MTDIDLNAKPTQVELIEIAQALGDRLMEYVPEDVWEEIHEDVSKLRDAIIERTKLTEERDEANRLLTEARAIRDDAIAQANREKVQRESAESEGRLSKRRADQAWEVIHTDYWRNNYDELNAKAIAFMEERDQYAAVVAEMDSAWTRALGRPLHVFYEGMRKVLKKVDPAATLAVRDAEKEAEGRNVGLEEAATRIARKDRRLDLGDDPHSTGWRQALDEAEHNVRALRTPQQGEPQHG